MDDRPFRAFWMSAARVAEFRFSAAVIWPPKVSVNWPVWAGTYSRWTGEESNSGCQVRPPSLVFQAPPPAAAR
jgi:hypothetical protein